VVAAQAPRVASSSLERTLLGGVILVAALLVYGWILVPAALPWAPGIVLAGYAIVARFGVRAALRHDPRIARVAAVCGALGAVIFVPSILIEYAGRTTNNAATYGSVFVLWFLSGALAARLTGRVTDAVLSATASAMISSLAFITAFLGSYYVLRGSALQDRFFRTEGDYEDFARSGMTDFNRWIVEDMFGGTFFHLLLGALLTAALGSVAGLATNGIARLLRMRRA
jgi:pimeloyl-ACP methyl ester carboxylesterase